MQLNEIKLNGFKSFSDHTVIPFKSKRTTIVGPNGCGKSNVIDAVRWVMGESSAKQLRGEAMSDVIFNGTSNRKPVGQASIELIFDNTETTLTGEYAQYNEISIRREVNRDGTSQYYLNSSKCRRKDIVNIFLGTGLGPRSYAIIEQGIISKLIEAKPEELRVYLEEAAGISRYKERRRETENRIQHTRDNLARLTDIRLELEKQLDHLKRQANAANRYQTLKQQQRSTKAQLQALNWRTVDDQVKISTTAIHGQETELEAKIAEQTKIAAETEQLRSQQTDANHSLNEIQKRYYGLGAEISRIEQKMQHHKERCTQLGEDLAQLDNAHQESRHDFDHDKNKIKQLQVEITNLEPQLATAKTNAEQTKAELDTAEQTFEAWQTKWDEFNAESAATFQQVEVAQTTISHLKEQIASEQQRLDKLLQEQAQLAETSQLVAEIAELQNGYTEVKEQHEGQTDELAAKRNKITEQREQVEQLVNEANDLNQQLQQSQGRQSSLAALQQAALQNNDSKFTSWLAQNKLTDKPRLVNKLQVAAGWERAVETVLNLHLEAICVDNLAEFNDALRQLTSGNLTLFDGKHNSEAEVSASATLAEKVEAEPALKQLLSQVYTAESLAQALELRSKLKPYESVVTHDGIWLGASWLKFNLGQDVKSGMLQRKSELKELDQQISKLLEQIDQTEQASKQSKAVLFSIEEQYQQQQQAINELSSKQRVIYGDLTAKQTRLDHIQQRHKLLQTEISEHQNKLAGASNQLAVTQASFEQLQKNKASINELRTVLLAQRDEYQTMREQQRETAQQAKQAVDELVMRSEAAHNQITYLLQNLSRAEKQIGSMQERREQLQQALRDNEMPLTDLSQQLQHHLEARVAIENELTIARQTVTAIEHGIHNNEQQAAVHQEATQKVREQLEQLRIEQKALQVRGNTYNEQIKELGFDLAELLPNIPENASSNEFDEQLENLAKRIERLGPINLAAIDEHQQKEQRKNYLDAQNNDLVEALTTLENAIHKIDQETKERFQQTFGQVNDEFQRLFPIIFGGGRAALTLTDDDLLNTGVTIMAQPPGKRNSTIHLLSGGEKALTAIALVFGIFKLNPAPFCMLDEVDAPLDDHNVYRFCNLVKEMSNTIQFIIVSHNKTTMEMAEQLIGITMHEPGVSRMVSVDLDEAVKMASS
jgi:chromosome segregation protein